MRKWIFMYVLALTTLFLMGCGAKKDFVNGNYDAAIRKSVTKLRKKPTHMKSILVLEDAFRAAQNQDLGSIDLLRKEGAPENWERIFHTYTRIKNRQELVKTLSNIPPSISLINVAGELVNAKKKSAEFYYVTGEKLLNNRDRISAREAYGNFQKVTQFYPNFREVRAKLQESRDMGTTFVLLTMKNQSGMIIPAQFEQDILSLSLNDLNGDWTMFHTQEIKGAPYHYHAKFNIMQLVISPERLKETTYEETTRVKDGWEYVLDANGNVAKDSLGNDIKADKYKKLHCRVIEIAQHKSARVSGNLQVYSLETKQLLKQAPVTSDAIFEHFSAKAVGDKRALSKKSKKLLRNRPLPFPSDADLILTGSDRLKGILKGILHNNRRLFI